MKPSIVLALLLVTMGCGKVAPTTSTNNAQLFGTWREGFKAAHAEAVAFRSWSELYDWAESGSDSVVLPLWHGRSTDLAGERHDFIDTRAGGYRDAQISIFDEMHFIANHNSGDTDHFFKMTVKWINAQDLDQIIPPGHF
jgi:hypothetical protein